MKTLSFTTENSECYDMLYEVVRAKPVTGIEQIIKAATVIEKLKDIGTEKGSGDSGIFKALKLKTVPTNLELEDDYFKYIKDAFEVAPMASSIKIELLAQTAKLLKSAETG